MKMNNEEKEKAIKDGKVVYLKPNEHNCPYCGEKFIIKDGRETCPKCGSEVVGISRITGYCSFDERFNEAKVKEREDRLDHSGEHKKNYELTN